MSERHKPKGQLLADELGILSRLTVSLDDLTREDIAAFMRLIGSDDPSLAIRRMIQGYWDFRARCICAAHRLDEAELSDQYGGRDAMNDLPF